MSTAPDRFRAPRPPASEILQNRCQRIAVRRELAVLRDAELGRARPVAGVTTAEAAAAVPVTDPGARPARRSPSRHRA
jgi:hypothetical protein